MRLIDDTPVEVVYHPTRNVCRCVVTCWDFAETSTDDIIRRLQDQNVTDVRRITQRIGKNVVNTGTMILTIRGPAPPSYVRLGLLQVPTRPYYPSPLLCYKCLSYGHTKTACKETEKCQNCSTIHDEMENCNRTPYCKNCGENEKPTSRTCAVYRREQEVIKIKVDEGLTYAAAREAHRSRITSSKGSFASIVQQRLINVQAAGDETNELKQQLKLQEEQNRALIVENEKLRNEITNLRKSVNELAETTKQLQLQLKQQPQCAAPSDIVASVPTVQLPGISKMQTRQQHRNTSESRKSAQYSSSEAKQQIKRHVSSPPKKPAKLRKSNRKKKHV